MSSSWLHQFRPASRSRAAVSRRAVVLRRRFTLEPLEGRQMLSTLALTVTTVTDNGSNTSPTAGSLRAAIIQADAQPAGTLTSIDFKIGTGSQTIRPPIALPQITRPVVLDGTTQGGYAGQPLIDIDGGLVSSTTVGFTIASTASGTSTSPAALKGLEITDFGGGGVSIQASEFNLNSDDIGLVVTSQGTHVEGNDGFGVQFSGGASNDSLIGSTLAGTKNGYGVVIAGTGSSNNTLSGDFIGTDPTGKLAVDSSGLTLGNSLSGLEIDGGATHNTVTTTVISNNGQQGVTITGAGTDFNVLSGDFIGTDVTGTKALADGYNGVLISAGASSNSLGGTTSGARDIISGNTVLGVDITDPGTSHNVVEGDYIGTTAAGTAALPNRINGVDILSGATFNTVGGTTPGTLDLISGNAYNGVVLGYAGTSYNVVEGDYIGTDLTGAKALANGLDGVDLIGGASLNTVGGTTTGARDILSGNGSLGVDITDAGTSYNVIEGDYIGTTAAGTAALPNRINGVDILSSANSNTVGGTTASARDIISGNAYNGVVLGYAGTSYNAVEGDYIGTDLTGTKTIANGQDGVEIIGGAGSNLIGGTTAGARNLISGNTRYGVLITDSGTTGNYVEGNYIGTEVTGTKALPNSTGVVIQNSAAGNFVGYVSTASGNLISGNSQDGVIITDPGTNSNLVYYDKVGTDVTGELPVSNGIDGVIVQNSASTNYIFHDLISANVADGVLISGCFTTSNQVMFDSIGLDAGGLKAVDQTGKAYSNATGVDINAAVNNVVEACFISGNNTGVFLDNCASDNSVYANDIGTGVDGQTNVGNLQDGVLLEFSCANVIANDLIIDNGDVGVLGANGSTAQDNIFYGDTYTLTIGGVTYGNKNGATKFE